jgi:hypothetical protein
MGLELLSQWLDAAAFVFVTPEFLGEKRVEWLQSRLRTVVLKLGTWAGLPLGTSVTGLLLMAGVAVFVTLVFYTLAVVITNHILSVIFMFAALVTIILLGFLVFTLFLRLVAVALVRIVIFSFGALCFLASRGIMIYFLSRGVD